MLHYDILDFFSSFCFYFLDKKSRYSGSYFFFFQSPETSWSSLSRSMLMNRLPTYTYWHLKFRFSFLNPRTEMSVIIFQHFYYLNLSPSLPFTVQLLSQLKDKFCTDLPLCIQFANNFRRPSEFDLQWLVERSSFVSDCKYLSHSPPCFQSSPHCDSVCNKSKEVPWHI